MTEVQKALYLRAVRSLRTEVMAAANKAKPGKRGRPRKSIADGGASATGKQQSASADDTHCTSHSDLGYTHLPSNSCSCTRNVRPAYNPSHKVNLFTGPLAALAGPGAVADGPSSSTPAGGPLSEETVLVSKLGSQRVNNIFTHLRKIAQHPLLVSGRGQSAQSGDAGAFLSYARKYMLIFVMQLPIYNQIFTAMRWWSCSNIRVVESTIS